MLRRPAVLTLVDGDTSIVLRPEVPTAADAVVCTQWDLGSPDVRVSSAPRVGADGNTDTTTLTGPRTATFDLIIRGDDPYTVVESLARMTHPSRRPVLRVYRTGGAGETYEMQLRGNPFSISYGKQAASMLQLQLSFEAPLGYLLGPPRTAETIPASNYGGTGFSFPITFPLGTGFGSQVNPAATRVIGGSAPVAPVVNIYGPVTNPRVSTAAGDVFAFTGLSLPAGEFVQIDMGAGTVRRGGDPQHSVFHLVDWSVSTFWSWPPGSTQTIRYTGSTGRVLAQWREARLTI
jgi:hypothetical protein